MRFALKVTRPLVQWTIPFEAEYLATPLTSLPRFENPPWKLTLDV